jgi:hypothetical protein
MTDNMGKFSILSKFDFCSRGTLKMPPISPKSWYGLVFLEKSLCSKFQVNSTFRLGYNRPTSNRRTQCHHKTNTMFLPGKCWKWWHDRWNRSFFNSKAQTYLLLGVSNEYVRNFLYKKNKKKNDTPKKET